MDTKFKVKIIISLVDFSKYSLLFFPDSVFSLNVWFYFYFTVAKTFNMLFSLSLNFKLSKASQMWRHKQRIVLLVWVSKIMKLIKKLVWS